MEKTQIKKKLQFKQISSILLIGIERYIYEKDRAKTTNDLHVKTKNGSVKRRILENK